MFKLGVVLCTGMVLTFATTSFAATGGSSGGIGPGSPPGTALRFPNDPPTSRLRPPSALGNPFAELRQELGLRPTSPTSTSGGTTTVPNMTPLSPR